jgi:hypothetical protein
MALPMRSQLVVLILIGATFGVIEAATVTYLRTFLDPRGALFPLVELPTGLLAVEMARELATLALLASVAFLAARSAAGRLAAFMVLFGVWDLAYYAALRLTMHWPAGLQTWDLLFLMPVRWLGPVWAPMCVAATLIVAGSLALDHEARHGRFRVRARHGAAATAGALVVISSFVWSGEDVPRGIVPVMPQESRTSEVAPREVPVSTRDATLWTAPRYPVERLLLGEAIAIVAFVDAWRRNRAPAWPRQR